MATKIYIKVNKNAEVFFYEVDPAFCMDIGYIRNDYDSRAVFQKAFAMTYGMGLTIRKILTGIKFKTAFFESKTKMWLNFYAGYSGR